MKRIIQQLGKRPTVFVLAGVLVAGLSATAFSSLPDAPVHKVKLNLAVDEKPIPRESTEHSYAPVVQKVAPGVVRVFTTARVQRMGWNPPGMEDWLRRFLPDGLEQRLPQPGGPQSRQQGVGSGVIVSREGYILTNNHVVENADEVRVALQDGRDFIAKVVGRDPKTDIAVLKVDAKNLPTVPLADSDKVEVGDVVLAVGNPFGIGQTVTKGIVSAKGRGNMGLDYEDFIQTDAAINPGNSGGALVDSEGRLIGINTAIISRSGGNQGIGFAIPTNMARDVMEQIVEDGHVSRGYLGVMIQDVTPSLAEAFKLGDARGALVGDVTADSPAAKAGLRNGDVITEVNGKKVTDSRRLRLEVASTRPGSTMTLKVLRDGEPKEIRVRVRELPGNEQVASNDNHVEDNGTLNGVAVDDLNAESRSRLRIPGNIKGVVVSEVQPGSAAAEAGLRPGDVIQEINRQPIQNAEQAVRLTERADNKRSLLRVWRDGGSRYVVVDESKAG
jgi:serine protease Do